MRMRSRSDLYCPVLLLWLALLSLGSVRAAELKEFRRPQSSGEVTLSYNLEVKGDRQTTVDLTSLLPQSFPGQQEIESVVFSPAPSNIFRKNGNRYASWRFKGRKIKRKIEVTLRFSTIRQVLVEKTADGELSERERSEYTRSEEYLDVGNNMIRQAARQIGRRDTELEQVRAILDFVCANLESTKAVRKMHGAVATLKRGRGDCTDYTDLLVTLCRQFKLPARHVSGYLLTRPLCLPHSWAEVYIRDKGWIIVDPLHMDLGLGSFEVLHNKYLAFSRVRNDSELNNGMLYVWTVLHGSKARVLVRVKVRDEK